MTLNLSEPYLENEGFSICSQMFIDIIKSVKFGSNILELGSGLSTKYLSKFYHLYSIEHDQRYVYLYKSRYIYAPVKNGWYDIMEVAKGTADIDGYDFLLIDGPTGNYDRSKFIENLGLFDLNAMIGVDDLHRKNEMYMFKKLEELTGKIPIIKECGTKAYGILIDDPQQYHRYEKQFATI